MLLKASSQIIKANITFIVFLDDKAIYARKCVYL